MATFKLGAVQEVERWSAIARDAVIGDGALGARSTCLAGCAGNLVFCGSYTLADALLEAIQPATGRPDAAAPDVLARFHQARAVRALGMGDVESSLQSFEAALVAFEQAGERRDACAARANLAVAQGELGDFAGAESLLRGVLAAAEQMGLDDVSAAIQSNLGCVLACAGKLDEAKSFARTALEAFQRMGSPRMAGSSQIYLARIALLTGDIVSAEREARAAADTLEIAPPLRPAALAVLAQALLAQGRLDEALAAARESHAALETLGGVEEGEALIRLTYAEALDAAGHEAGAAQAITSAEAALLARADKLRDPRWRESFLGNIPEHVRTRELARRWSSG